MNRRFSKRAASRAARLRPACALVALTGLTALPTLGLTQTNPLVTGKKITLPPLGAQTNVGSLPMNLIVSPDGKYAVSSDMGFRQSLHVLDTTTGASAFELKFDNNLYDPTKSATNGLYFGLAFAPAANSDGSYTLYAAQGANNTVAVLKLNADGSLTQTGVITGKTTVALGLPAIDFPAGVALDGRDLLYVANNDSNVPVAPGSVAIYDTRKLTEVGRVTFSASFYGTPNFPLAVAALSNGSKVFVGSQRDSKVYVIDATTPTAPTLAGSIATGAHPIGLLLNKAQTLLFVANANSDTISVVDTATNAIVRTILLRPDGARGLAGATPNGLTLSPDEKTLYVTLSDMNAVAVVDTARYRLRGYLPVGWNPTSVVASPDGKRLLVANAKGTQTRYPNPGFKSFTDEQDPAQYDLNLIEGNVQTLALPTDLTPFTQQVVNNNKITPLTDNPATNPLAAISLKAGKIKHVVYIIKENRTYDQILGDLPQGNGDPSLTLFGRDVTPNLHALAERFVLLDNFYDISEASGDGWPWSTQSLANEYVIKNLPYNYSGRGRNYDFEGQNNGYIVGGHPAKDVDGKPLSVLFPFGAPPIPDVSEAPAGHIWDLARSAGLSYRNYGFFYSFGVAIPGVGPLIPDNYPGAIGLQPPAHDLAGISDYDFRRFDGFYADSEAATKYAQQTGDPTCLYPTPTYGKYAMPSRYSEWKREFDEMLAKDATGGAVPAFQTVRLMNDHTIGFSAGLPTPRAEVADNDYGVGQLVEAISKSPIWKETAIFVIEDDAQDGPDHIDAHRSTCYVISPWIKKNSINSAFYNTDSVLKTMELLLGLPAMSQYDAVADPIMAWDATPANDQPYAALLPAKDIICEKAPAKKTPGINTLQKGLEAASAKMDFAHPDSAPARQLNAILWKSVKGDRVPMPEPRRGLRLAREAKAAPVTRKGKPAPVARHDDDDD